MGGPRSCVRSWRRLRGLWRPALRFGWAVAQALGALETRFKRFEADEGPEL